MKNSTIKFGKTLLAASAAFLSVGTIVPVSHFVSVAQGQEVAKDEHSDAVEARREMDEIVKANELAAGRARAFEVASRLKMSPEEFVDFFKAEEATGKRTEASDRAWAKLLKASRVPMRTGVTEADFQSADIASESVSAYIHLKKSKAADTIRITPEDLATIQSHWTLDERMNFGKVMRRAADIAAKGETATTEDAYQKALEEMGFREKANKYCRK